MATDNLLTSLQQAVTAVNNLSKTLTNAFPLASGLSTSATTGAITFSSSQPAAFLSIITSSGGLYKVALYGT